MARLTLASLLLLASCSSPGAQDGGAASDAGARAGAFLLPDCAPDDGAALSLRLYEGALPECSVDAHHPVLSFSIFESTTSFFPIEAGDTITSPFGAISCPADAAPCRLSESWSLTFETFAEGAGASGTYLVTFDDGETVSGRFDATWCDPGVVCG